MGLLNKIYFLVQAGRCLFDIICDDKFEQSEAEGRVFRKFDDRGRLLRLCIWTTFLLTPKRRWKSSLLSLGERFKVKFGIEEAKRTPAFCGGATRFSSE